MHPPVSACGLLAAALLAAGCGGSTEEARPETVTLASLDGECAKVVSSIADALGGGDNELLALDALGFAAPEACASLAELESAIEAEGLDGLEQFVIETCLYTDLRAIVDTPLCEEARSQYELVTNGEESQ